MSDPNRNYERQIESQKYGSAFHASYLYRNYDQYVQSNQPSVVQLQPSSLVLQQLNNPSVNKQQQSQIDRDGIVYSNHMMVHPQTKEMVHREQQITVVSREEIESVWRNKCQQLQQALTEVQTEVMRLRGIGMAEKVTYVEDTIKLKLNQLYLEIDRLNKCLLDMSLDLDGWKNKYLQLEGKTRRHVTDIDIDKMRSIMLENEALLTSENGRLRNDLDEWQKRYRILELSLSELRGHDGTIKELDARISQLRQDLERTNIALQLKSQESEDYRLKYIKVEQQLREQATYEVEIRRLKELIDNRNRELEQLRLGVNRENAQISELQQTVSNLRPLADQASSLQTELDLLRSKYARLESSQGDNKQAEEEIRRLREELKQRSKELDVLRSQVNVEEVRELRAMNERLEQRLQDQEGELQLAMEDSERLVTITQDAETWKKRFIELNRQYNQLQEEHTMMGAEQESKKQRAKDESMKGTLRPSQQR